MPCLYIESSGISKEKPIMPNRRYAIFSVLLTGVFLIAAAPTPKLAEPYAKLVPLHTPLPPPRPGEWLAEHEEPGQTLAEYKKTKYVKAAAGKRTIYLQVLGDMTEEQQEIVDITKEYLGIYFGLPVKTLPAVSLANIPEDKQRDHPHWGNHQYLAPHLMEHVLLPNLPKDACVLLGFTAEDLYPADDWNYVFGQAAYQARVGVWSLYRNGDPEASDEAYALCLKRTLRLATHETLHMFSMLHCTQYRCNLNGVNHMQEADATPLWVCPECLGKLRLATSVNLGKRYDALIAFHKKLGWDEEVKFYEKEKAIMAAGNATK